MASVPRDDDDQLMRYVDGELARDEARDVERLLAEQPDARVKLEALAQLREALQARFEVEQEEVEPRFAAMWGQLRSELHYPPRPTTPSRAPPRFWTTVREWFESYRSHLVTGAVAAAAGALIATLANGGPSRPQPAAPMQAAAGAEVESVEVPDGSAMVFQIPGEGRGEAPTTVIWVTEDTQSREGPI